MRAERRKEAEAHEAQAPGADDQDRLLLEHARLELLQGAVGGEPRAGIGRGDLRLQVAHVEEVARMRHEHVRGIAAAAIDAERARPRAILLVAALTDRAFAAADPGEDDDLAPR